MKMNKPVLRKKSKVASTSSSRESDSMPRDYRAAIVTSIPCEIQAVCEHLIDQPPYPPRNKGQVYEHGYFVSRRGDKWSILVAEIGPGNVNAALECDRMIEYHEPDVLLFVGVAGGIKDVQLGDVVAATKVEWYESAKVEGGSFRPRPDSPSCTRLLISEARAVARDRASSWLERLAARFPELVGPAPSAFVGPIAAGEKVVASTKSQVYKYLRKSCSDALAVEMEGKGILTAAHANPGVAVLIIRGISDLIDDKERDDKLGSQPRAAKAASAFAFEILDRIGAALDVEKGSSRVEPPKDHYGLGDPLPDIFTGRIKDIENFKLKIGVNGKADPTNLLVIWGMAGVGKTTILKKLVSSEEDVKQAFPDHIFACSLGHNPSLIQQARDLARALGHVGQISDSVGEDEAFQKLRDLLRNKRVLIVVDDVYRSDAGMLFRKLRGEASQGPFVVFTTRFRDVAQELLVEIPREMYTLCPLDSEEAFSLLIRLIPEAMWKEHELECRELVGEGGFQGHPLAIVVAGKLLSGEFHAIPNPKDLLRQLLHTTMIMKEKAPPSYLAVARETNPVVGALFEWSTDLLSERDRWFFARLGTLPAKPATFDWDYVESAWGLGDPSPAVRRLWNMGLLEFNRDNKRYSMHALWKMHAEDLVRSEKVMLE